MRGGNGVYVLQLTIMKHGKRQFRVNIVEPMVSIHDGRVAVVSNGMDVCVTYTWSRLATHRNSSD